MQIHRYRYGIREFSGFSDYGLRFLAMVSEKAQPRYRALLFWENYGLEATDLSQDSESECVERFNRTVQEQFIDYHEELLLDPDQFNRQLIP